MIASREKFLSIVGQGPQLTSDAIVILCGEDATPRMEVGLELFRQGAAPVIVLSGGIDKPPRWQGAKRLDDTLIGRGVNPDRILIDNESKNTHEQAEWVTALAKSKDWHQVLLVASNYHIPRAFLSFVASIRKAGLAKSLRVLPVSCYQTPWSGKPEGMQVTRLELLSDEVGKILAYGNHVASWDAGLEYLQSWEKVA